MKLGLIVRTLSEAGGSERYAAGFARFMLAQGHEVEVICARVDLEIPGLRTRPLGAGGRGRIWRALSMARAADGATKVGYDRVLGLVRAPNLDVIRAGGGSHAACMRATGWSLADAVERRLDRQALSSAGLVIANSQMAARQIQEDYGVEKVSLVRNGVDLDRFCPVQRAPGPKRLLFLGSGFRRKGLDTALRAMTLLPRVELLVAGQDRALGSYRRRAAALGLRDRVRWLGAVAEPESLIPTCDALVLPTRYDPFANVTLEALACGVPVATTLNNGAAEVLPEPWMAVADPLDASGLAGVLERIMQSPALREASRAAAERHPSSSSYAALEQILAEPRS